RLRLHDGTVAWVHERGHIIFSPDTGLPKRVQAVLRVITARKLLEMDLTSRIRIDALTGLPNRYHLLEMLDPVVGEAKATHKTVSYAVLAIDNMTYINEAIGPDAADRVILGAFKRLRALLPHNSEIGRVGGDQLGFILHDCPSSVLAELAEKLLTSFRDEPVESPVCPVQVSISMGGVVAPASVESGWEAMIRAEQALREAQRQGRNSFVEYTPSEERVKAHRRSLEVGQQALSALKNNGVKLAFQPLVNSQTGAIESFEALIRMTNEKGEFIPAGLFIPIIEQFGLAHIVDRKVLDLAVEALNADANLRLAINVSGLTASQKGWPDIMRAKLRDLPDIASRMTIEITETAAILDIEETKRFVEAVHELGGTVALDDFGSGVTSIRYLHTLGVDTLKIDRELLSDVTNDTDQQVMVRTLLALAKGLGLETVAEGVETAEVAAWLKAEKVDKIQGYFFGKPEVDVPANICARYAQKALQAQRI
ncbi:MAG TPA: bifunctional diguanylate cyclase/phosphodiesterase, partial [Alphaproteobacteria bacterium]|nr:bifunctional diguanylate cyclase/phosphodiesterase [Alphaproteobacteria bacterium]